MTAWTGPQPCAVNQSAVRRRVAETVCLLSADVHATIVRAVLLPPAMKLPGRRNWYLPKGLHWLPKFEHEPTVAPAGA
jgi:hypothetical protein